MSLIILNLLVILNLSANLTSFIAHQANTFKPSVLGSNQTVHQPTATPPPIPTAVTPSLAPAPTLNPSAAPTPIETNQKETAVNIPSSDSAPTTVNGLLEAVNSYRLNRSLSRLQAADSLCQAARQRADQLLALGHLDNHQGNLFPSLQPEFSYLGEVLYSSTQSQTAEHIVASWHGSDYHRSLLQDPKWDHGCGGMAGNFAVFLFGKK